MYIVHASFKLQHSLWTMTILAWMQSPTQHVRTPHRLLVPASDTHAHKHTHKRKQQHTFARTHSGIRHQSMPICLKHPHTSTHTNTPWRTHHHTWPPAQGTWDTSGQKIRTRGTATMHTDRMLRHFLAHRNRGRRWDDRFDRQKTLDFSIHGSRYFMGTWRKTLRMGESGLADERWKVKWTPPIGWCCAHKSIPPSFVHYFTRQVRQLHPDFCMVQTTEIRLRSQKIWHCSIAQLSRPILTVELYFKFWHKIWNISTNC